MYWGRPVKIDTAIYLISTQRNLAVAPDDISMPLNPDLYGRWWSTYRMLKRLRFLREAISHYFVDYPGYYSPRVEDLLPD